MIEVKLKKKLFTFELNVDLTIQGNDFVSIFGPSGAGKTTILRLIAGLDKPDSGYIYVDGKVWYSSKDNIDLPVRLRKIGFVFQDYALFENMSVAKNVEFALESKKDSGYVDELLELVHLKEYKNEKISLLSGGQKQRLALIRALARKPKVLLLDEPMSALDWSLRATLQDELLFLQKKFNITAIMVSHEISEVAKLSDYIFVIKNGKITKQGKPQAIFDIDTNNVNIFGTVIDKKASDLLGILKVLIGNSIVYIPTNKNQFSNLSIGDKILITTKAFNFSTKKIILD
ncbi:sulfate/molybdate ABC transporter ATP-binding protein [Desulfurella sp.]|uniref:sulfate/molybdate ABC transporter ATP-binding protein n=1 Tax=Desulfurella sp. TaxID=1962857 RepID=UPI0025B9D0A8|nr:ABC transporter ATP-binding protein [Desulfurella sp.]